MRRLLFFRVFATTGATNPVDDFDKWEFQRRQGTRGIVNGSHSISGAASTPEPPVVLVNFSKLYGHTFLFPRYRNLIPNT